MQMPLQHCTIPPDIALEKSQANIEQKDKIVGNMNIRAAKVILTDSQSVKKHIIFFSPSSLLYMVLFIVKTV